MLIITKVIVAAGVLASSVAPVTAHQDFASTSSVIVEVQGAGGVLAGE